MSLGDSFEGLKTPVILSLLSLLSACTVQDMSSHFATPAIVPAVSLPRQTHPSGTISPHKLCFLQIAVLVGVFHSNKKATNTYE